MSNWEDRFDENIWRYWEIGSDLDYADGYKQGEVVQLIK